MAISILISGIICVYAEGNDKTASVDNTAGAMTLKELGDLKYYLYCPNNPTDDMPLIIYLHDGTNKNLDVTALLATDGFPKYLNDGYYGDLRAYVVVPKLESTYKGWVNIYEKIRDLIRSMKNDYSVGKVALTGHSMGGTGTYQVQIKLPNSFDCIAPMSGSVQNTDANIAALSKTKVWAFVGTDDTIVDPDSSRAVICALQDNGADARITELDGATHFDVPSLAYKDNDFIQWLVNCGEITPPIIRGDANRDGIVSISDATAVQRHIAELEHLSDDGQSAADVDDSGQITINDATLIQKYLAEFDDPYHIGEQIIF